MPHSGQRTPLRLDDYIKKQSLLIFRQAQKTMIIKGDNIMPYIKNIEHEKVVDLAGEVEYMPGQVISKTLAQNDAVSVTLFAFEKAKRLELTIP